MKMLLLTTMALGACALDAAPVPDCLFGHNIEHTRSCMSGGLSAQLVRNRKFAGKPSRVGVASGWERFGAGTFCDLLERNSYTRHARVNGMYRHNETAAQMLQQLEEGAFGGIEQGPLALRGGVGYAFKAVVRNVNPEPTRYRARLVAADGQTVAARDYTTSATDWSTFAFSFTPKRDVDATLQIGVVGRAAAVVGVVSLLPDDAFRGMRRDVVENLRRLRPSFIRWPGGNFAGEFRWRDGELDRDMRAPIQSCMENETQTYTWGYDDNDFATDDLLALCEEIGATPFFTLNPVWDTPEESVEWVKSCRGKALHWSLGNEMGYPHMEGPHSPREYAELVVRHAKAIKAAVPEVTFSGSGRYPWGGPEWIEEAAKPLAKIAPAASFHDYGPSPRLHDYTSPERIADLLKSMDDSVDQVFACMAKFRRDLPREIKISLDEWNLWYVWHREEGITEGFWAARYLHRLIRDFAFFDFDNACYFQPINEGAIRVRARTSSLTPIGEVMVRMRRHAGGELVKADLPVELLATDHPDGSRLVTAINSSPTAPRTFTLDGGACVQIAARERLQANRCVPGSTFAVEPTVDATLADGRLTVTLPPLSVAALRLEPARKP